MLASKQNQEPTSSPARRHEELYKHEVDEADVLDDAIAKRVAECLADLDAVPDGKVRYSRRLDCTKHTANFSGVCTRLRQGT